MEKLASFNREKVIDMLMERLTFERTGVKLYDAILAKMRAARSPEVAKMLEQVEEHRNEEKEHEEWLEEQIRALGGDAHKKTEMAKVVEIESQGIAKVILDGDPELSHLFHALLTAELADNAGWDLLVQLADEADDKTAKKAFKKRLHEEEDHLLFTRKAVIRMFRREVLGQEVGLPTSAFPPT